MSDCTRALSDVAALVKKIQVLEDKEAIRDVIAKYSYLFDVGRYNDWYELFTEDSVYKTNPPFGEKYQVVEGKENIKKAFAVQKHYGAVQHLMVDVVVQVDGDIATAVCYQTMVSGKDDDDTKLLKAALRSWVLERIDGRWLIKEAVSRLMSNHQDCLDVVAQINPAK
jgi:ketosteroid isomerase-like protein